MWITLALELEGKSIKVSTDFVISGSAAGLSTLLLTLKRAERNNMLTEGNSIRVIMEKHEVSLEDAIEDAVMEEPKQQPLPSPKPTPEPTPKPTPKPSKKKKKKKAWMPSPSLIMILYAAKKGILIFNVEQKKWYVGGCRVTTQSANSVVKDRNFITPTPGPGDGTFEKLQKWEITEEGDEKLIAGWDYLRTGIHLFNRGVLWRRSGTPDAPDERNRIEEIE